MPKLVHNRAVQAFAAAAFVVSVLLPAAGPAAAQEKLILRAGTDQKIASLNPFAAVVVAEYEAFTLNYDLLANFGANNEPVPGFASSWSTSTDGKTWTFKIPTDRKWSDGTPVTAEDARWTYQLMLDENAKEETLGSGYLDSYLQAASVTKVSAPDAQTLVVETSTPNQLILYAYLPILPKHIWSKVKVDDIAKGNFTNPPTVVGTGPYQAVETKEGDFTRFVKNPYWDRGNLAADEVIIQTFGSSDTMVQALKNGDIDYARGIQPDQFNALKSEPGIVTVAGASNGYSELAFNCYSRNGGVIPGGGASTKALQDPKFRDALAWAVDQKQLVDKVLGGYGDPGTTVIPPFHARWHIDPPADIARHFDIEEAKKRLDAAGYTLNAQNQRLDKEGKPIVLRLTWPSSEPENGTDAQFIAGWFTQLGIKVDAAVTEDDQLIDDLVSPEGGGKAKYDMFIWGWVGDPDVTSLLKFFTSSEIGISSDSQYENPRIDELYQLQLKESDETKRHDLLAEFQTILYTDAPYVVLYYDNELDAYRTDKFAGWTNQPLANGAPLFVQGSFGYWQLTDASAATPSPEPSAAPSAGASAAPSAAPSATPAPSGTSGGGDNTVAILAIVVVLVVVVVAGWYFLSRRGRQPGGGEEE